MPKLSLFPTRLFSLEGEVTFERLFPSGDHEGDSGHREKRFSYPSAFHLTEWTIHFSSNVTRCRVPDFKKKEINGRFYLNLKNRKN